MIHLMSPLSGRAGLWNMIFIFCVVRADVVYGIVNGWVSDLVDGSRFCQTGRRLRQTTAGSRVLNVGRRGPKVLLTEERESCSCPGNLGWCPHLQYCEDGINVV